MGIGHVWVSAVLQPSLHFRALRTVLQEFLPRCHSPLPPCATYSLHTSNAFIILLTITSPTTLHHMMWACGLWGWLCLDYAAHATGELLRPYMEEYSSHSPGSNRARCYHGPAANESRSKSIARGKRWRTWPLRIFNHDDTPLHMLTSSYLWYVCSRGHSDYFHAFSVVRNNVLVETISFEILLSAFLHIYTK